MTFNIVETFLGMTLLGAEWVLWLLVGLSILSIAIIIERILFFRKTSVDFAALCSQLIHLMKSGSYKEALQYVESQPGIEAQVASYGLNNLEKDKHILEGAMEGMVAGERHTLDRGLVILGTLGNNAPFIGLFGTVVGIIKAFHDLANNPGGGPSVVMSGISEALVATAVGLLVAIPAVIAFNFFNRIVKRRIANAGAVIKLVLTHHNI